MANTGGFDIVFQSDPASSTTSSPARSTIHSHYSAQMQIADPRHVTLEAILPRRFPRPIPRSTARTMIDCWPGCCLRGIRPAVLIGM